jgi:hypothetical protein
VEAETIRNHGDLFASGSDGYPALDIRDGGLDLGSVVAAPFGVGWRCDFEDELAGARSVLESIP